MKIPGSNLLNKAFKLIQKQKIVYYQFLSRAPNSVGQYVDLYSEPVEVLGSFQAFPKNQYEQYGLDLNKEFFKFYISFDIKDIERGVAGDELEFNSERFKCVSSTNWYAIDGWKELVCERINVL